jgi:hypothetical protein
VRWIRLQPLQTFGVLTSPFQILFNMSRKRWSILVFQRSGSDWFGWALDLLGRKSSTDSMLAHIGYKYGTPTAYKLCTHTFDTGFPSERPYKNGSLVLMLSLNLHHYVIRGTAKFGSLSLGLCVSFPTILSYFRPNLTLDVILCKPFNLRLLIYTIM